VENKPVVEVDFAELSDGSLVEMIENPEDATKTLLAVYRNGTVQHADQVEDKGRILVPLPRADYDLQHVRLAQGAHAYDEIGELIKIVAGLINRCLDVEREWCILMTAFAMSTWFLEKVSVAPYLALVGLPGSGKTTAMRILGLLCYRGLLTADISSSAFYDVSHRIRPTILLDETLTASRPRELLHLLKASSTRDFVSLRKDKARLAYGPKVFTWLELPNDPALHSRCVIVPMHKTTRTDLWRPDDPRVLYVATQARMRLLQFRFERFRDLPMPEPPAEVQLSGRPLDIYRALALPFDRDQKTCRILGLLLSHQNQLHARMLSVAHASTIRILYDSIHTYPEARGFSVSALTAAVNSDLESCGESAGLTPRKVGDILTSLSFTHRTRQNNGYFLWLERSDRTRIHATARDYGIEGTLADSIEDCKICTPASSPAPASAPAEAPGGKQSVGGL
jgi:hypothetical protein